MPIQFSVVIPTLNAARHLPETLNALMPGLADGMIRELIISDGGSGDGTRELARDVGAVLVDGAPGRGGQLARGAQVAKADWLVFLHADTHLPPDWPGALAVHAETQPQTAAVFRLRFRARGVLPRLVAGFANLRSQVFGLPYGDQGLVISRALYERVGGYRDQPLMEDVAISQALKGRIRILPLYVETGAERYVEGGWLRRGARNLMTLTRYLCGADPIKLAQRYHKP
ncbi:MAG: TIGR04283 family arsenosugar biosynthesis glycosyltransferase [Pseudomonadota bacterium]